MDALFVILIVIFSAVVHEVMHGVAADYLGDPTARYAGRLTLNPLVHLDTFGSVILPGILALTHSPILFGWAKPVPYNPYNLRPGRFSEAIVAAAGPVSNMVIALLAGLIIRSGTLPVLNEAFFLVIVANVMLCFFNLMPVPPLDGSKVFASILPYKMARSYDAWRMQLEANPFMGMAVVLLIVLFLGDAFGRFIYMAASAIAGM